jgi:hypothetical protein
MQQPMSPQTHTPGVPATTRKKSLSKMQILAAVSLFAVAALATLMLLLVVVGGGGKTTESAIKKDQYQAVFLTSQDGQVYFGKLESYNDMYYRLTDIFYVRVEQRIQPEGQNAQNQTQQSISLAKLGNELHGPEDEMFISRDKVLFWENLKESGQVVTAIREYKKNPDAANAANNANTNGATGTQQQSTTGGQTTNTTTNTTKP